jgi:opacity protein-like surface antigen
VRTVLGIVVIGAGPALLGAQEPAPAPSVVPRVWAGAAAQYARATGEFASYVRDGGGVNGHLMIGFGAGGNIGLRLSGHGLVYGSQTRRYSLLPGISADVTTSNFIAGLMVGPQISAGGRALRAYGFGGVGFNYFATTSEVNGSGSSTPFASTTNYDDITTAFEAGGGVQVRLGGMVYLDLGARYVSNGRVNYVTRDGVTVVGNNLVVNPVNSEVTLAVYHLGVTFGIPIPGPGTPKS